MPEARATKQYHQLNLGINTELSELSYDEGFTADECNYELLVDGSRRRRKGVQQESGGSDHTVSLDNSPSSERCHAYLWRNVGGDPTKRFWVHKIGSVLYFTNDDSTPSASWNAVSVDLDAFALQSSMADEPCDFSQGKGYLFISGRYIKPLYLEYNAGAGTFTATEINIRVRDYTTIDDGILIGEQPATLTADHEYNLLNRGWRADDIDTYNTNEGAYPSKAQTWHKGYKRTYGSGIAEEDGDYSFDSDKLAKHPFSNASSPVGSLYVNVFYDTIGTFDVNPDGSAATVTDATPTVTGSAPTLTIELDETSHGWADGTPGPADDVQFVAGKIRLENSVVGDEFIIIDLGGTTQTVTDDDPNSDGDAWQFELAIPSGYIYDSIVEPFVWISTGQIERSSGTGPLDVGPKAIQFHEGRVFYAGIPDPTWADYIFYSRVAVDEQKFRECHMEADPTAMDINNPTVTDGGYIQIPNIGNVIKMLSLRDSLLIFSDEGVWEISGRGIFSPSNYQVRQITNAECDSTTSPVVVEGTVFYTGPKGVYIIAPNQYTNVLEAQNISDDRIRSQWNLIPSSDRARLLTVYDDAKKRLYFFFSGRELLSTDDYGSSEFETADARWYNTALIFDLRINAWYKHAYSSGKTDKNDDSTGNGILYAFALSGEDNSDTAKKLKFCYQTSSTNVKICDQDRDDYDDEFREGPIPFMYTGWDNIGGWQRRRTAPVVTVFSKRTETGYNDTGSGWEALNDSSTTMTAYWDWTDDAVTNKIGSGQEVYRHVRNFIPASATDEDGYPVVVTRNKVRGRGRALQLKFEGASEKDSHLLGFTINYKVSKRV